MKQKCGNRTRRAEKEKGEKERARVTWPLLHRVLRGLRLLLADGAEHGHERHVEEAHVLAADAELELAQRLDERRRLDVADGAAQLDHADVGRALLAVGRHVRDALYPLHHHVRHVRHHLHGLAQVVALALALETRLRGTGGGCSARARARAAGCSAPGRSCLS